MRSFRSNHTMGIAGVLVVVSTVLLLSLVATPTDATSFNVTLMLNAHPSYSQLNAQLTSTGVADEINARSSLTLLVMSDAVLTSFLSAYPNAGTAQVADLLRYHVLLQYLDVPEINTITVGNPSTITTLYQTTGRAAGNSGSVNVYNDGTNLLVGQADVNTAPNTTIVTNVTQIPYNISIIQINNVLAPTGFGAATTGANLSAILQTGKNFNTFRGLLQTTGVDSVFAALETGQGITIFAPTDAAFAALPSGALSLLTPAQTKVVVEYHALTSYYTLGSLTTLNNPTATTVATTDGGAGTYTVNVSSAANGVVVNSGLSQTTISSTLYDTPPTVVFAVDTILLPPAIFAAAPAPSPALVPVPAPGPAGPVPAPSPLTPTPAPSPLSPTPVPAPSPLSPSPSPSPTPTPTPTPTSAPAPAPILTPVPAPSTLSPVPSPFPGPPAPPLSPEGSPGEPSPAPEGPGGNYGASTRVNLAVLAAMALASAIVML